MDKRLTFKYDRITDSLYIDTVPPYTAQESEELGDDVIARLNPDSSEIENLEILFFSTRLLRTDIFDLPIEVDLFLPLRPCAFAFPFFPNARTQRR